MTRVVLGAPCVYCEKRVLVCVLRADAGNAENIVAHRRCERHEERWREGDF